VCRHRVTEVCDAVGVWDPDQDDEREEVAERDRRCGDGSRDEERKRRDPADEIRDQRERGRKRPKPVPVVPVGADREPGEKRDAAAKPPDDRA